MTFIFILVAFFCVNICFIKNEIIVSDEEMDRKLCVKMKNKYHIIPGESFGILPVNLHQKFLSKECDRFFCKPNALAGKGIYKCEPIEGQSTLKNIA